MKNKKIRVAITGIGMITPLGHDTPSTWKAIIQKQSGVSRIQLFDASGFPTQIAAEVKYFKPDVNISRAMGPWAPSIERNREKSD